jgi:hypothetical protein
MSTETIKRSDVGEKQAMESEQSVSEQAEAVDVSGSKAENAAVTPNEEQQLETGEDNSDEIQSQEPANETENEGESKPESKSEVDWEQVAKRERWKRQKKAEELDEFRKSIQEKPENANQSVQPAVFGRPKRPKLYDDGIDGDEDILDLRLDVYEEKVIEWRDGQRRQSKLREEAEIKSKTYFNEIESYNKENPEYGEAWEEAGKPKLPSHVDSTLMKTGMGPRIEHYLYTNLDKLQSVMRADPLDAVIAILEIKNELSSKPTPSKGINKSMRRTISDAPEPSSVTKGSGGKADSFANKFPGARINSTTAHSK